MKRAIIFGITIFLFAAIGILGVIFFLKYKISDIMEVPVEEVGAADYPEDPSYRSSQYGKYAERTLILTKTSPTHFDFVFESQNPNVATIIFKDIDLNLYIPTIPKWIKGDANLEIISLVDREWNRQQVSFPLRSPNFEVVGGDGFESRNLYTAELARNCLNAGLWEVLLFTKENGQKALYYQGWFQFPLGHYKDLFEAMNITSYWKHGYRLEHWFDPAGKYVDLSKLRTVTEETEVDTYRQSNEEMVVVGEQLRKSRMLDGMNPKSGKLPTFIPPGRYSVGHPWDYEYERIAALEKTTVRNIACPASKQKLQEVELLFRSSRNGKLHRFIVGGVNLQKLPQLSVENYAKGLYMPMGIGISPFYQSYRDLELNPPSQSPYYSLLLDENDRWINHHEVSIDGPILHRDVSNPNVVHLYLMSYERQNLVGHFVFSLETLDF